MDLKNIIVYGDCNGVFRQALKFLTQILLDGTKEVPACVDYATYMEMEKKDTNRYFFVGTKENNPYIAEKSAHIFSHQEEYNIQVAENTVIIEGMDEGGVLYGCIDFYQKYWMKARLNHDHLQNYFNDLSQGVLPDFQYSSYPAIKQRGLWTWGHVIYDYQGYIDNMVRLKMNTLIIWDDFVPLNAEEMIAYAHQSNIKVYWGFAWGWGLVCSDIDLNKLDELSEAVVQKYEETYAHLGGDGIYFQSFTELKEETINGVLIADAVTGFVNDTAEKIFAKHPNLDLQFGLHATSVKDRLKHMQKVDPRITIMWEDAGAFPYQYIPEKIQDFDETVAFTQKILSLRGEEEKFGAVLKGFTCLRWDLFEHQQGPFYLGAASSVMHQNRIARKAEIWKYVQAYWLRNGDKAQELIRTVAKQNGDTAVLTALVEDGMFEKELYYPVALFGAMLWEPETDFKDLMCEMALNQYITFA